MQSKFQSNFESLTEQEADYFADAISGAVDSNVTDNVSDIDGGKLFNKLVEHRIDHKTAVMSLANDPSIMAIVCLEKVIGKEIIREVPKLNKQGALAKILANRPKTEGAPRPRLAKNDPRIIFDVVSNPKKAGSASHARYEFYENGMTVTAFLAAGGTTGDVQHDVSKGFIKLRDANAATEEGAE